MIDQAFSLTIIRKIANQARKMIFSLFLTGSKIFLKTLPYPSFLAGTMVLVLLVHLESLLRQNSKINVLSLEFLFAFLATTFTAWSGQ